MFTIRSGARAGLGFLSETSHLPCCQRGQELRFPRIEDRSAEAGYAKASLIACGLVLWVNAPRTATRPALIVSGVGSRTVARSGFLAVPGIDDRRRIACLSSLSLSLLLPSLPYFFLSVPHHTASEGEPLRIIRSSRSDRTLLTRKSTFAAAAAPPQVKIRLPLISSPVNECRNIYIYIYVCVCVDGWNSGRSCLIVNCVNECRFVLLIYI